jgi:hypothetical protein
MAAKCLNGTPANATGAPTKKTAEFWAFAATCGIYLCVDRDSRLVPGAGGRVIRSLSARPGSGKEFVPLRIATGSSR